MLYVKGKLRLLQQVGFTTSRRVRQSSMLRKVRESSLTHLHAIAVHADVLLLRREQLRL